MKVKLLQDQQDSSLGLIGKGEVVDVHQIVAEAWVIKGIAEFYKEPTNEAKKNK